MKDKKEDKKTLFVKFLDRTEKKISIPDGCKITFGPLCPGTKGGNNGESATALRVYKGTTQIAVFVEVQSFYEVESVSVIAKKTKTAHQNQSYEEGGVAKVRSVQVHVSEWSDELEGESSNEDRVAFAALKDGPF